MPFQLRTRGTSTHVYVDRLTISLRSAHDGRDHDQRLLGDEVPYASLLSPVALRRRCEVELESLGGCDEQHDAADVLQQGVRQSHYGGGGGGYRVIERQIGMRQWEGDGERNGDQLCSESV